MTHVILGKKKIGDLTKWSTASISEACVRSAQQQNNASVVQCLLIDNSYYAVCM